MLCVFCDSPFSVPSSRCCSISKHGGWVVKMCPRWQFATHIFHPPYEDKLTVEKLSCGSASQSHPLHTAFSVCFCASLIVCCALKNASFSVTSSRCYSILLLHSAKKRSSLLASDHSLGQIVEPLLPPVDEEVAHARMHGSSKWSSNINTPRPFYFRSERPGIPSSSRWKCQTCKKCMLGCATSSPCTCRGGCGWSPPWCS